MAFFLDLRSSSNAPSSGSISIELGPAPELFGLIGLGISSIEDTVITLSGTIGLIGDEGDPYTIQVVRGESFDPANIIYTAQGSVATTGSNELHSFHAQDLSAPAVPTLVYTAFISGISTTVRNGPEVFFGIASQS